MLFPPRTFKKVSENTFFLYFSNNCLFFIYLFFCTQRALMHTTNKQKKPHNQTNCMAIAVRNLLGVQHSWLLNAIEFQLQSCRNCGCMKAENHNVTRNTWRLSEWGDLWNWEDAWLPLWAKQIYCLFFKNHNTDRNQQTISHMTIICDKGICSAGK